MLFRFNFIQKSLFIIFISLSILFPTKIQFERLVLLTVILILSFIKSLSNDFKFRLSKNIFFLFIITMFISLLGIFHGVLKIAPGVFEYTTIYLIWPLVFIFLISINFNFVIERYFEVIFPWIYLFIAFSIISLLPIFSFGDIFSTYNEILGTRVNFNSVYPEFSTPVMGWFIFAVPFFFFKFILKLLWDKPSPFDIFFVFLSLVVLLLSGRRGMWFSTSLSLFLFLLFLFLQGYNKLFKVIFLLIPVIIFGFIILNNLNFEFDALFNSLKIDLDASSDITRINQIKALYNGWLDSPIFGQGIGAITEDRHTGFWTQPWAFELQYNLLLFQVGILGGFVYFSATIFIIFSLLKRSLKTRDITLFSFIAGFTSLLLANSTNPYLNKFDYLLILFFSVHILNRING